MRVGIDVRLWNQTGVGRYIRSLVSEILKIDDKNEYVLFAQTSEFNEIKEKLSNSKNQDFKIVAANLRWHSLSEQLNFPKILNTQNLDLMHFTYFSVPIRYRKPFVITIHDLIPFHFATGKASTLPAPLYKAKSIAYKKVLFESTKKSKKILVPLDSVKEDVIKTLKVRSDKIVVTKEGFDLIENDGESKIDINKFGKYFLYVGNCYPHKNVELLIRGFNSILASNSYLKLVIVGRKDYFYERLIKNLKKENKTNIEFLFDVSDNDLINLYKNSQAVVSASKMEGFGLVPLEAISCGSLPILSDIPAFREVCGNSAIYFDPNSVADMVEKMTLVLHTDRKDLERYRENGKKRLENFSWNKTALQTLAVYESCNSV